MLLVDNPEGVMIMRPARWQLLILSLCLVIIQLASAASADEYPPYLNNPSKLGNTSNRSDTTTRVVSINNGGSYPVVGIMHIHSTFSDGVAKIEVIVQLAEGLGWHYVVFCDHFDDIDITKMGETLQLLSSNMLLAPLIGSRIIAKCYGFDNYWQTCRQATQNSGVPVVPGLEVELGGDRDCVYDPSGSSNRSHLLIIGPTNADLYQEIYDYLEIDVISTPTKSKRMDEAQDYIGMIAHNHKCAVVVAHPFAGDPVRPGRYTYYKNHSANIDGVECYNVSDEDSLNAMGLINRDQYQNDFHPLAATSGVDFHGIEPTEVTHMQRTTILNLDKPLSGSFEDDCTSIARAIRSRSTVALSQPIRRPEFADYILNSCNVYVDDILVSSTGLEGAQNKPVFSPNKSVTLYMPGKFFYSRFDCGINNQEREINATLRIGEAVGTSYDVSTTLLQVYDDITSGRTNVIDWISGRRLDSPDNNRNGNDDSHGGVTTPVVQFRPFDGHLH